MSKGILWAIPIAPILAQFERIHPNGEPHHITLQYGTDRAYWHKWIDLEFNAIAYEEVWDEYSQAILVTLPLGIPRKPRPHITVSWAAGRSPNDANRMIAGLHFSRPFAWPFAVPCRIEFFEWANPPP